MILKIAFLLTVPALAALARVGDAMADVEKSYGEPVRVLKEQAGFRMVNYAHGALVISVGYLDNVSKREGYARRTLERLSEEEVQTLLDLNIGSEKEWTRFDAGDDRKYWIRSDGRLVASLSREENFLLIQEKDFREPK